jgi:rfaE bifunctional protein nucleotidyltransferase chain/domain
MAACSIVKIALFQNAPGSGSIDVNMKKGIDAAVDAADKGAGLIVMPELFTTGITNDINIYKRHKTDEFIKRLAAVSSEKEINIVCGLPEPATCDATVFFNSLFVIRPDGRISSYRKIHLFSPMGEDKMFIPGNQPLNTILDTGDMRVNAGVAICFDLRFPQLSRHLAINGAELLIISALWPKTRQQHLHILARARAVENQCFVTVVNGCGLSGGVELAGSSALYAPDGTAIARAGDDECLVFAEADMKAVSKARSLFTTAIPEGTWHISAMNKFCNLDRLCDIALARKRTGQKMVFTNGCFDILHPGHTAYLEEARSKGDFLVVGLNSDSSIRRIKCRNRPINSEHERIAVLSALASIDYVVVFEEDTPLDLIKRLKPDILVKGADWEEDEIVGADIVRDNGGKIIRIPFTHDTSTTGTIDRILHISHGINA